MQPVSLADFGVKGADLEGLFYLRNVVDADKLVAAVPAAKAAGGKVRIAG